jgi:hypothetical protein
MDAVEYLKARERYWKNGNTGMTMRLEKADPEKAVYEIEKWAGKYPVKTRAKDFLEKHPSAPLEDGYPVACAEFCGYGACGEKPPKSCQKCWDRPLEEEE